MNDELRGEGVEYFTLHLEVPEIKLVVCEHGQWLFHQRICARSPLSMHQLYGSPRQ